MAVRVNDRSSEHAQRLIKDENYVLTECLLTGPPWVHLRLCLTCGHVGCCDSSKNRHATKHFESSGHAVVQSREPGEDWRWCYIDEIVV